MGANEGPRPRPRPETMTTKTETETTRGPSGSPYDPWPIESADGWRIIGHPSAGTFSVEKGPRYLNTETEEDTEPVSLYGVKYSVRALCVPDDDGGWHIAHLSGFRVDNFADLTRAAKVRVADEISEVVNTVWDVRGPEIADTLDRGKRKVDREGLIRALDELKRRAQLVRAEIVKLDAGENYNRCR